MSCRPTPLSAVAFLDFASEVAAVVGFPDDAWSVARSFSQQLKAEPLCRVKSGR